MRVAFRGVTGVIRLHPAASPLPAVITSTLVALFVLVSVSVRIMHLPLPGVPPGSAPATRAGDHCSVIYLCISFGPFRSPETFQKGQK
jgi:hypothetical protein